MNHVPSICMCPAGRSKRLRGGGAGDHSLHYRRPLSLQQLRDWPAPTGSARTSSAWCRPPRGSASPPRASRGRMRPATGAPACDRSRAGRRRAWATSWCCTASAKRCRHCRSGPRHPEAVAGGILSTVDRLPAAARARTENGVPVAAAPRHPAHGAGFWACSAATRLVLGRGLRLRPAHDGAGRRHFLLRAAPGGFCPGPARGTAAPCPRRWHDADAPVPDAVCSLYGSIWLHTSAARLTSA